MTEQMSKGYISLHRKIQDNWIWLSEPFSKAQAWVDLLLLASHSGSSFFIRGNKVDLKIGEIGWSKENLGLRWKWSEKKVLNFLNLLEKEGQITKQKTPYLVVIRINNYEEYQNKDGQKTDRRRTEDRQKTAINNEINENNDNNGNKDTKLKIIIPNFIDQILFDEFLQQRKKDKNPLEGMALKLTIEDLENWENEKEGSANTALRNAVKGGWKSLIKPESKKFFDKNEARRDVFQQFLDQDE